MKLYHPTIPGKVREVPDAKAEEWTAAGWRKTAPKTDEPKGDGKK